MTRWKRWVIWIATFLFGLYYLVEFMLPEQIGGSFDKSGIGAATAVNTGHGWDVFYSALSGPLKSDGTPDEKLIQYQITRFPLARPSLANRRIVLSPSPFREWDYFGCKNPSILVEDGVWKMWYTGLDHKDRLPRVMYCESRNGLEWNPPVAVITDPLGFSASLARMKKDYDAKRQVILRRKIRDSVMDAQLAELTTAYETSKLSLRDSLSWISGGVDSACVVRDGASYRMWFCSRGSDHDAVGEATSRDGHAWTIDPTPLPLTKSFDRITSVTAFRVGGEWKLLLVGDGDVYAYQSGALTTVALPGLNTKGKCVSANVTPDASAFLLLVSYFAVLKDGKTQQQDLAAFEGAGSGQWAVLGQKIRPGPQGIRSVPIELNTMANWLSVVGALAVALGLIGLMQIHLRRIFKHQAGWFHSLFLILSMIAMCVSLLLYRILTERMPNGPYTGNNLLIDRAYDLLFANMTVPLGSTMFSLLACFLVSAAYRAFRIRGRDATIMAVSATIVMLAQVPVGDYLTSWMPRWAQEAYGMTAIRQWYLDLANSSVQRGISFGVFVGSVAMALRIWLSLNRTGPE